MIKHVHVSSLPQFIKKVCEIRTDWTSKSGLFFEPWFRGQGNADWPLMPSLYRSKIADMEEEMRSEFIRRGTQLLGGRSPQSEWEWYFLMQHYRSPTRLLDWTDGALIALFFALNSNDPANPKVTSDAAVWVLDPNWLNERVIRTSTILLTDWRDAKPYLPKLFDGQLHKRLPVAIDPVHVAERLRAQRSRFTVHGTDPRGLEKVAAGARARLIRISITRRAIPQMRLDLSTCGLVDSTIFPDLEGLSAELHRYAAGTWWQESST